jgi:hypothetical protein
MVLRGSTIFEGLPRHVLISAVQSEDLAVIDRYSYHCSCRYTGSWQGPLPSWLETRLYRELSLGSLSSRLPGDETLTIEPVSEYGLPYRGEGNSSYGPRLLLALPYAADIISTEYRGLPYRNRR